MLHLVFDGNNAAYRADMSMELYTSSCIRTSAISGVLKTIQATAEKLKERFNTQIGKVIVTWDYGHSPLRKAIYPNYKIGRKLAETEESRAKKEELIQQIDELIPILPSFGFYSLKLYGWEGDDIAYLTCRLLRQLYPQDYIIVITTDEDYHQFLSFGNIGIYNPIKDILYAQSNYYQLMGINFSQFLDYKILKGDSSDSINGIQGIGEKTAKDILNKYQSLTNIYTNPKAREELSKSKRTAKLYTDESLAIIRRNRQLIDISTIDFSSIEKTVSEYLQSYLQVDEKAIFAFCQKYELMNILTGINSYLATFS